MDYNEKLLQITSLPDCATIQQNIEKFLKNMVSQKKADGVVFGLSGGIDSVTVAYLAAKVFGKNALALVMPDSTVSPSSETGDALKVIGEIGLDYYYTHSPKQTQLAALRAQLDVAVKYDLPVIFHVREAFDDFWPVFDSYEGKIRGVLHSFTDTKDNLQKALDRGLYIGVNGISTFTKDEAQRQMFDAIPLDRLLFETDAPFLTPHPFRGKVNEPALVRNVAEYHAQRRQLSLEAIALQTTKNAQALLRF